MESHVHMPRQIDDTVHTFTISCHTCVRTALQQLSRVSKLAQLFSRIQLNNYLPMIVMRGDDANLYGSRSCSRWRIGKLFVQSLLTQVRNRVVRYVTCRAMPLTSALGNFKNGLCIQRQSPALGNGLSASRLRNPYRNCRSTALTP